MEVWVINHIDVGSLIDGCALRMRLLPETDALVKAYRRLQLAVGFQEEASTLKDAVARQGRLQQQPTDTASLDTRCHSHLGQFELVLAWGADLQRTGADYIGALLGK